MEIAEKGLYISDILRIKPYVEPSGPRGCIYGPGAMLHRGPCKANAFSSRSAVSGNAKWRKLQIDFENREDAYLSAHIMKTKTSLIDKGRVSLLSCSTRTVVGVMQNEVELFLEREK